MFHGAQSPCSTPAAWSFPLSSSASALVQMIRIHLFKMYGERNVYQCLPLTKPHNCLLVHGILHRGQEREFPGVRQVDHCTSLPRSCILKMIIIERYFFPNKVRAAITFSNKCLSGYTSCRVRNDHNMWCNGRRRYFTVAGPPLRSTCR